MTMEVVLVSIAAVPTFFIKLVAYWAAIRSEYRYKGFRPPRPVEIADGRINQDCKCISCGYNLRTLPATGVCPECGNPYDAMAATARPRSPFSPVSAAVSVCFFDIALSMILLTLMGLNSWCLLAGLGAGKGLIWLGTYAWYAKHFQRGKNAALSFIGLGLIASAITDGLGAAVLMALISNAPKC